MPDETTYEWFHKDRKFFFPKKDGEITHCYQLARELCSDVDKNRWWEVGAVVPKDPTRHKNIMICDINHTRLQVDDLVPVPLDSEIEHQLHSLDDAEYPIAAVFIKNIRPRHPRRHQWTEMLAMDHIPKGWQIDPMTVSDDRDFVSAPFLAD